MWNKTNKKKIKKKKLKLSEEEQGHLCWRWFSLLPLLWMKLNPDLANFAQNETREREREREIEIDLRVRDGHLYCWFQNTEALFWRKKSPSGRDCMEISFLFVFFILVIFFFILTILIFFFIHFSFCGTLGSLFCCQGLSLKNKKKPTTINLVLFFWVFCICKLIIIIMTEHSRTYIGLFNFRGVLTFCYYKYTSCAVNPYVFSSTHSSNIIPVIFHIFIYYLHWIQTLIE